MKKHFVEFLSPGTFTAESSVREIDSWDVGAACEMVTSIKERHGATPYGFRFFTKERGPDDLDSKVTLRSGVYYLGGTVRTLEEVLADNKPDERILRANMQGNGYARIIENYNSLRFTAPLKDDDVVLDWPAKEAAE